MFFRGIVWKNSNKGIVLAKALCTCFCYPPDKSGGNLIALVGLPQALTCGIRTSILYIRALAKTLYLDSSKQPKCLIYIVFNKQHEVIPITFLKVVIFSYIKVWQQQENFL